jgi:hypothetical protein
MSHENHVGIPVKPPVSERGFSAAMVGALEGVGVAITSLEAYQSNFEGAIIAGVVTAAPIIGGLTVLKLREHFHKDKTPLENPTAITPIPVEQSETLRVIAGNRKDKRNVTGVEKALVRTNLTVLPDIELFDRTNHSA